MSYQGAEARTLDSARRQEQRQERASRLSVVEGGGLDARVRRGVSTSFIVRVRIVVAVALACMALGAARVAISSATASCLSQCSSLRSEISQAESARDELQAERSVLSSSSRIDRIATQNYGMVRATKSDTIDISGSEGGATDAAAPTASADDAQSGSAAS